MKNTLIILLMLYCGITHPQTPIGPNNPSASTTAGTGVNWNNTSNGYMSDDSRARTDNMQTNDISEYLIYTGFNFTVPIISSTVVGIKVEIERRINSGDGNMRDETIILTKDGTSSTGSNYANTSTNWPSSDDIASYGGNSNKWGTTWTPAEINASTFGVMIKVKKRNPAGDLRAQIDHVKITVYYNDLMPIELLSFTAACATMGVSLKWVTASETNNSHFTVSRTCDSSKWQGIATVGGAGNSNTPTSYWMTDKTAPRDTLLYYRLSQTDFDGKSETFSPIAIICASERGDISIVPNPFSDELEIKAAGLAGCPMTVTAYSISGASTQIAEYEVETDAHAHTVNVSRLDKGMYFVIARSCQSSVSVKMIKE